MHLCAAKCCESSTSNMDNVQNCVERCSVPLNRAQNYVQNELIHFQRKLQRCVLDCNDSIKYSMPNNKPSNDEITKYTNEFEKCAKVCVDKHIGLIPTLLNQLKQAIAQGNFPTKSNHAD